MTVQYQILPIPLRPRRVVRQLHPRADYLVTLSVVVAVLERLPLVPVTVSVYCPRRALRGTFSVMVDEVPVDGFGENVAVAPDGWPLSEKLTLPVKSVRVIVTLYETVPPARVTEREDGVFEREKSPVVGDGSGEGAGAGAPAPNNVCSRRLGEPDPALVTLFGVALLVSACVTADGVAPGFASR